ncbi:MAG: hypothetical protein ABI573_07445 [Chloroflexota bacterium]
MAGSDPGLLPPDLATSATEMLRRMSPGERLAAAVDASESIRTLAEAGNPGGTP